MDIILENVIPGNSGHLRLLPNINRSGRALPDTPSSDDFTKNAKVDNELAVHRLTDKEIYSLMIVISDAENAANTKLTLEITFNPKLFRFLNASGKPLDGQNDEPFTADSPFKQDLTQARKDGTKARGVQYFIETQTFAGSPLLASDDSVTIGFRIVDGNGVVLLDRPKLPQGDIRTADVILLGDDATAQRVFMCDVGENGPSISELSAAAKVAGIPLTIIPIEIGNGDAWIQDQFQICYTATQQASQMIILHLPRLGNDSAIMPGTANLRNFVETYFPSDDIGIIKDFWTLPIVISDGVGGTATLTLPQSYLAYKLVSTAPRILRALSNLLSATNKNIKLELPMWDDIFAVRLRIDDLLVKLVASNTTDKDQLAQIGDARAAVEKLSTVLASDGGSVKLKLSVGNDVKTLTYTSENSERLKKSFADIAALHSSTNYGGNIEVSPKMKDAPYGKILAGSVTSADLKNFLTSRGALHPLVTVYTDWLEVGHIDEIASFITQSGDFSLVRASPKLALHMLDKLVDLQKKGVLVTRLMRGKKWVHKAVAGATDPIRPPNAWFNFVTSPRYDLTPFDTPIPQATQPKFGDGAYHDDRQFMVLNRMKEVDTLYLATITCADLLDICRDSNRTIEDFFLADGYAYSDEVYNQKAYSSAAFAASRDEILPKRLDKVIGEAFPGTKVYWMPVLFDRMRSDFGDQVSAVTPAMINFQTLNNIVAIPRPYGPRMRISDAVTFINDIFKTQGYPTITIDENYIRRRGLDKTWHWTRTSDGVAHAILSNMPTQFDKEYKESQQLKISRIPDWLDPLAAEFERLQLAKEGISPIFDVYAYRHENDPLKSHPAMDGDNLYRIAGYFKDGFDAFKNFPVDFCKGDTEGTHPLFDKYETDLKFVMDKINAANPGVFDQNGAILSKDWIKIEIPEDTTDIFELYTQVLMEWLNQTVQWVDSWYYHTHKGGIHCGTNVLRSF